MAENGGDLTAGQRLTRIEHQLENLFTKLDVRITEHKKANEQAISQLVHDVMRNFEQRVAALETMEISEVKVKEALERYQAKQMSNFRWAVTMLGSLGVLNLFLNVAQSQ